MLTIEQIRDRLKDKNMSKVSELSGVSYKTIRRIKLGNLEKPSYYDVEKLSNYFMQESKSAKQ